MKNNYQLSVRRNYLTIIHEFLFSSTMAFAGVSFLFLVAPRVSISFIQLNYSINSLLGIQQTDLLRGTFEYYVPSALVTIALLVMFRRFSSSKRTQAVLSSAAGIAAPSAAPAFWLYLALRYQWPRWSARETAIAELVPALFCVWLYLKGKLAIPWWCSLLLLTLHYAFWFWICGGSYLTNFLGPVGVILSFASSLTWAIYVHQGWPTVNYPFSAGGPDVAQVG
jgi:hypothetical protein